MQTWDAYLDTIQWVGGGQSVRQWWNKLKEQVPNLRPPRAQTSEDNLLFFMCWDKNEHYFDIDLFPDGTMEWFYRNRTTREIAGCDDPIKDISGEMINYLKKLM